LQQRIGDHALLADRRTAALVSPDGNIAWLCWPRVDSPAMLLSILDDDRGGCFRITPHDPQAVVTSRRYHAGSLVLETAWKTATANLVVDDALACEGAPTLLRRLSSDAPCDVEVRFKPAFDFSRHHAQWHVDDTRLTAGDGVTRVALEAPAAWRVRDGQAISRFETAPGKELMVSMRQPGDTDASSGTVDDAIQSWRVILSASDAVGCSAMAERVLSKQRLQELVSTSIAVLLGLLQRSGGIVAAPTTSLPQWPRSSRTWDYRYSWLRDASLAGIALWRARQHSAAHSLCAFLADAINEHGPWPVMRVDGGVPPAEEELWHLSGHQGARPVRVGNAAASQLQLDAPAEFIELAFTLAAHTDLPAPVQSAVTTCAEWLHEHANDRDHGIWEIRGEPRRYTHSRMMASVALRGAARLADEGKISGDASAWRPAAEGLRAAILASHSEVLQLHDEGGGADAALSLMAHVGFAPDSDPLQKRTLQYIVDKLDHDGLLDRYEGQPDAMPDPCGPFIFPTFWLAEALQRSGADGSRHFEAAAAAASALGLFGEVADPRDRSPLGNYPQVQSHAAFLIAALNER
jgi:GH15 family glucan-1,4-alpha-glucosidase